MKTFFLLCLFFTAIFGGDAMPQAAQALIDKSEADIAKIHADLATKLTKQQDIATKKGDLTGAMAIKSKIEELDRIAGEAKTLSLSVMLKEQLKGTLSFAFPNGHVGQVTFSAGGADVPGFHGIVTYQNTTATISWSNGTQWTLTSQGGKIFADASDGRSALVHDDK